MERRIVAWARTFAALGLMALTCATALFIAAKSEGVRVARLEVLTFEEAPAPAQR